MKGTYMLMTLLLVTIALFSANITAEIYTWTDKNGKVHFSDKPIGDERVTIITPKENNNIAKPVNQTSQWQQDYIKAKQVKAKQAEKNAKLAKKNKNYCDQIKIQLATIDHGGRIYVTSPDGERSYQSDAQLKEKKKQLTKAYKKTCR